MDIKTFFGQRGFTILGTVVALLSMLGVLFYASQTSSFAACQARYNEVNNQRTRILTDSADRERATNRLFDNALINILLDPAAATPEVQRTDVERERIAKLGRDWITAALAARSAQDTADKVRADHPVPAPPSDLCGIGS